MIVGRIVAFALLLACAHLFGYALGVRDARPARFGPTCALASVCGAASALCMAMSE